MIINNIDEDFSHEKQGIVLFSTLFGRKKFYSRIVAF